MIVGPGREQCIELRRDRRGVPALEDEVAVSAGKEKVELVILGVPVVQRAAVEIQVAQRELVGGTPGLVERDGVGGEDIHRVHPRGLVGLTTNNPVDNASGLENPAESNVGGDAPVYLAVDSGVSQGDRKDKITVLYAVKFDGDVGRTGIAHQWVRDGLVKRGGSWRERKKTGSVERDVRGLGEDGRGKQNEKKESREQTNKNELNDTHDRGCLR